VDGMFPSIRGPAASRAASSLPKALDLLGLVVRPYAGIEAGVSSPSDGGRRLSERERCCLARRVEADSRSRFDPGDRVGALGVVIFMVVKRESSRCASCGNTCVSLQLITAGKLSSSGSLQLAI
jgi:hypothetical protein